MIAVCKYHLVMISTDLSEAAQFVHWKSETTSKTKQFFDNFFFLKKKKFSDFSQT